MANSTVSNPTKTSLGTNRAGLSTSDCTSNIKAECVSTLRHLFHHKNSTRTNPHWILLHSVSPSMSITLCIIKADFREGKLASQCMGHYPCHVSLFTLISRAAPIDMTLDVSRFHGILWFPVSYPILYCGCLLRPITFQVCRKMIGHSKMFPIASYSYYDTTE